MIASIYDSINNAVPILDAIGWLLALFYGLIPNFGVAIILLTLTIMLLLYPLTAKQAKSMIAMQRVQPEIKKLQAKYKHDRQKLNEEIMKFYQENKINPLSGCLPLLAQLPIFFALFGVLREPFKYVPTDSDLYSSLCDKGADLLTRVQCGKQEVNAQFFLSLNLEKSATDSHGDILSALPYFILVALVMVTGFMQSRQAQKRTPAANKQMAMVMKVLPVFFGLISLGFPSGLVLYFFVSNLWRLGQQEVIFRRHGSALHPPGAKPGSIDVASKERPDKAARRQAIESPTAETDEPEGDDDGTAADTAPGPIRPAKPAAPAPRATPAPEPVEPGPATTRRATGLRGFFQLPPPPEPNGGDAPPAGRPGSASASPGASRAGGGGGGSGGSGGSARAAQSRRRRNKKKRKR